MSVRSGLLLLLALGSVPGGLRAQEPQMTDVTLLPTDTLTDVAVTRREYGHPVIYFNPALIERVGPLLREFFIAHEYGHVFYDHMGGALAGLGRRGREVSRPLSPPPALAFGRQPRPDLRFDKAAYREGEGSGESEGEQPGAGCEGRGRPGPPPAFDEGSRGRRFRTFRR